MSATVCNQATSLRPVGYTALIDRHRLAAISYGFVFLHPFADGNGRIHRFLIHNILARGGFTPDGLMFPVSAAMLKNPAAYDASLEAFSRPLRPLVEYTLDDEGQMTVHNDTAVWYRYIDMPPQAEALFAFIETTIETELASELAFLANYDQTKAAIQAVVDMPDRQIDLFIRCCLQNQGQLSTSKRRGHFGYLTSEEIALMEQAVDKAFGREAPSPDSRGAPLWESGKRCRNRAHAPSIAVTRPKLRKKHEQLLAQLETEHGRKSAFWELVTS